LIAPILITLQKRDTETKMGIYTRYKSKRHTGPLLEQNNIVYLQQRTKEGMQGPYRKW